MIEDISKPVNWSEVTTPEGEIPIVIPETPIQEEGAPPPPPTPAYAPKYQPLWENLSKKVEGYTLPDKVVKGEYSEGETEEDIFFNELLSNVEPDLGFEPDEWDQNYLEQRKDPNFNRDEYLDSYIQKKQVLRLSDDELLFNAYKQQYGKSDDNTDGIDDDGINDHISKMSIISKKETANSIRANIQQQQNTQVQQRQVQSAEKIMETVNKTLDVTKDIKEFFGLKPDNAAIDAFRKEFPNYFKPDATGVTPFAKLMQDDTAIYQMLMVAHQNGQLGKSLGMSQGQETKEQIEQRLGLTDKLQAGGGPLEGGSPVLWGDATIPEK